jgi:GWxTD domain-containing protein
MRGSEFVSNSRRNGCRWARGRPIPASLGFVLFLSLWPAPAHSKALPEKYDRWLNEEVVYLVSDDERKAFLRLTTDAAREQFIQEFWDARNPLRGSGRNLAKDEHYQRLDYVNQNFGWESNTPGWKTDMGRTYILLGKPVSRAPFKGYGQICPLELWFYRNSTGNPSLPPFFNVIFYMPENAAEYRYYRPFLDGPLKLVRGTQFHTNRDVYEFLKPLGGDLARAAFSLVPGDPLDTQEFRPSITSDLLIARLQNYANDPWETRRVREARQLRAQVTSWFLVPEERPLEAAVAVVADPQGEYWLDYAVLIDDERLGRPDGSGNLVVSSGYRLFTGEGALLFEDTGEAAYLAYEQGRFRPFLLARRIPVVPGRFRLEMDVVNREAGRSRKAERLIEAGRATLSEPLLVQAARSVGPGAPETPFRYFGIQFVPAVGRVFTPSDSLVVLFQIQASGREERAYDLEYLLANTRDRDQRRTFTESVPGSEFSGGRILKTKTLPLGELEPGEYRIVTTLREPGSPRVAGSGNIGFRIQESRLDVQLYVAGTPRGLDPAVAAYLRGLASLGQNETDRAESYLKRAVERRPPNADALRLLASIYFQSGKHNQVTVLYREPGGAVLAAHPDGLAQVALSLAHTGELDAAAHLLADGQRQFPSNAAVTTAARQIGHLRAGTPIAVSR